VLQKITKLMKIASTQHDGGRIVTDDYDAVAILRFLPAAAGDEDGTVRDEPSGEERPVGIGISVFGCDAALLTLTFGVWECPFVGLCTLPCTSGAWPFDGCV
jgi:hypothetical protein